MPPGSREEIMRYYSQCENHIEKVGQNLYDIQLVFEQNENEAGDKYNDQRTIIGELLTVLQAVIDGINILRGM